MPKVTGNKIQCENNFTSFFTNLSVMLKNSVGKKSNNVAYKVLNIIDPSVK